MADGTTIASLGLSIDSRPAEQAAQSLDKLTASGGRAEVQAGKLTQAQKALADAQRSGAPISAQMIKDAGGLEQAQKLLEASLGKTTTAVVSHADAVRRMQSAYASVGGATSLGAMQQLYSASGQAGKGMKDLAGQAQLTQMQMLELGHVARSFFDTIAAGGSPLRALQFEAGRVVSILGGGNAGVGGTISALIGIVSEFAPIVLTAGAALGVGAVAFTAWKKAQEDAEEASRLLTKAQGDVAASIEDTAKFAHNAIDPIDAMASAHDRAAAAAKRHLEAELALAAGEAYQALQKAKQNAEAQHNQTAAVMGAASVGTLGPGAGEIGLVQGTTAYLATTQPDQTDTVKLAQQTYDQAQKRLDDARKMTLGAFADLRGEATELDGIGTKIEETRKKIADLQAAIADPARLKAAGMTVQQAQAAVAAGQKDIAQLQKRQAGPRGPVDQTDQQTAATDRSLAQAKTAELQAQLAITHDTAARGAIEAEIVRSQDAERQAQVARQIAEVQNNKGLSAATKAQITGQLAAVQGIYQNVAALNARAQAEKTAADLAKEAVKAKTSEIQNQQDLLNAQLGVTHSTSSRQQIEAQILKLQQQAEVATLEAVTVQNGYSRAEADLAQKRLTILQQIQPLQQRAQAEAAQAALAKEALDRANASRQNQVDVLQAQEGLAKSSYARWKIEQQIAQLELDQQVAAAEATIASQTATEAEKQIAKERLEVLKTLKKLATSTTTQQLQQSASSVSGDLQNLGQAIKQHDWITAWNSLAATIEALKKAFSSAGTAAEKVGAISGAFSGLGSIVGGKAGGVLSGIGSGIGIGASIGSIIPGIGNVVGGIIGGIGGLIGGIFGGGKSKEERLQELQQQQAIATQQRDEALQLELRYLQATGQAEQALNKQRQIELLSVSDANKALAEKVLDAEHQQQIDDQRSQIEQQLATAEGRTQDALNLQRADELKAIDPTLQALQQLVYQREDEAAAAAKAAQLAQAQTQLQIQLAQAEGNDRKAVYLQRQQELAALDPSLRALQKLIYAREDETAQAQHEADIKAKLQDLNVQLLQAEGRTAEATALQRKLELAAMDPELRQLQKMVWARQDEAAAAQQAADLAKQRMSLEEQYYDAIGDSVTATAIKRQLELEALDASLRPLQQSIYAAEDFAAAMQKVTDAISGAVSAVDSQISAAESEAQTAHQAAQAYRDLAASLGDTIQQIGATSPAQTAAAARSAFNEAMTKALGGDQNALGQLGQLASTYLDAAKSGAGSSLDYQRIVAAVQNQLRQAQGAALGQADKSDYTATLLDAQVGILKQIEETLNQPSPDAALLKQQTDLLAGIGGLLSDQSAQIAAGNGIQSAIQALTAIGAGYSASQVQAIINTGTAQQSTFSAMLAGINNTVQVLTDVRGLLGGSSTPPASSGSASGGSSTTGLSLWEQTRNAIIQGDPAALAQLEKVNPDLVYRYSHPTGNPGDNNPLAGETLAQFMIRNVLTNPDFGVNNSGRNLYADGGYTGAGGVWEVAGLVHRGEVVWSQADVSRAGGVGAVEALRRGVAPANDDSLASEVRALREEVAGLRAENKALGVALAKNTSEQARILRRWDGNGAPVRATDPSQPIEVSIAS